MTAKKLARIMMVEDDPDIQTIARMALETVGGYTVEVCDSGRQALDRAPEFKPDLILLDVMMPEMDGPTTFKGLRELPDFTDTPIVFCTAKAMPSELDQFRAMGSAGIIPKPFDPMSLASQVLEIWEKTNG
ncbi:MAG: response regulator [Rhodospirillales bacterium]|nr:response regulator [Rhodospirillales bacterium]